MTVYVYDVSKFRPLGCSLAHVHIMRTNKRKNKDVPRHSDYSEDYMEVLTELVSPYMFSV